MEEILENQIAGAIDKFDEKSICKENADSVIRELSPCMDFMERLYIDDIGDLCSKLSMGYYYSGDNGMAIATINKGIMQIEETYQKYSESSKKNFLKRYYYQMSELYFKKGWYFYHGTPPKMKKASDAFRNHVYYGLLFAARAYYGFTYYSFYPVKEYHIEDLKHYQLALSDPLTFNDPIDCPIFVWMKYQEQAKREKMVALANHVYSDIRIRCLVSDFSLSELTQSSESSSQISAYMDRMSMWSHYADLHRGYCVRYKFSEAFFNRMERDGKALILGKVNYVSDMNVLKDNITVQKVLFTKHKSWEYEQEWRLLYFDKKKTPDPHQKVPMPKGIITDIYFGVYCKESDKLRIIEALKGRKVQYHQMKMDVDPEHLYRLKAVPLDPDKIRDLYSRLADLQTCWDELMSIKDAEPAE